jgi:hypothetical protein
MSAAANSMLDEYGSAMQDSIFAASAPPHAALISVSAPPQPKLPTPGQALMEHRAGWDWAAVRAKRERQPKLLPPRQSSMAPPMDVKNLLLGAAAIAAVVYVAQNYLPRMPGAKESEFGARFL